jgi:hypothetical protein
MSSYTNTPIISFDQDWAPDFVCLDIARKLTDAGVRSTWFITHPSPFLDYIRTRQDLFEAAAHPNFMPGSSHGTTPEEVIEYTSSLVPGLNGVRMHGVIQSGHLLSLLKKKANISYDATTFMPYCSHLSPSAVYTEHGPFKRIPVYWADDHEFLNPDPAWRYRRFASREGLQVFSFHPIHVFLNSCTMDTYQRMRAEIKHINQAGPEDLEEFVNPGEGSANMLEDLLDSLKGRPGYFIKDL